MYSSFNKLIIIGNGFDLAHGLKTSYKDFLDWYFCKVFKLYCETGHYSDNLLEISNNYAGMKTSYKKEPTSLQEVQEFIAINDQQTIKFNSNFLERLVISMKNRNWIDIECSYFRLLKSFFRNPNIDSVEQVRKLNAQFDNIISELTNYINFVNSNILSEKRIVFLNSRTNLGKLIFDDDITKFTKVLNFNYTETLNLLNYADPETIIHIHGRAGKVETNPIIFGYGDESDPIYQTIEDSGDNVYLEHIKSFGYLKTNNYSNLLSYIDHNPFSVHIVGHSCGLSDRILLSEIFEHKNCKSIEIFFHKKENGDNFKEITQEISRHFKPQNKNLMRRKLLSINPQNFIPQI